MHADARAKRLGISRSEYVRRQLTQAATGTGQDVKAGDLRRFAETFNDLGDAEIMAADGWLIDKSALVRLGSSARAEE